MMGKAPRSCLGAAVGNPHVDGGCNSQPGSKGRLVRACKRESSRSYSAVVARFCKEQRRNFNAVRTATKTVLGNWALVNRETAEYL